MSFSRFYLTDLQVHSWRDKNQGYGNYDGRDEDFARDLVAAHRDRGVGVFALTDHLSTEMWPLVHEAGREQGVWVFPGFEASIHHCHLLFIWEPDENGHRLATQFMERLFELTDDLEDESGGYRTVKKEVRQVLPDAAKAGALVIAPHSTKQDMGFFASKVVVDPKDVIRTGGIHGFDVHPRPVVNAMTTPHQFFGDGVVPPWLMTTDTRTFDEVGERAVFMKLGQPPTLEGIKQALLAPATRIRFQESHRDKWGRVPHLRFAESCEPTWPRIDGVRIDGGLHDTLDVRFGPGLNALIGGKGTGKSALVEILRYTLDAPTPEEKDHKPLLDNRRRNLPANAVASVDIVDGDGQQWTVDRAGDDQATPTLRRSDGSDTGVAVSQRMPVRVFGQNELRDLGEPAALLAFLAEQAGQGFDDLAAEERELLGRLAGNASALSGIESEVETLESDSKDLDALNLKVESAENRGATALIERMKSLGDVDDSVKDVLAWPDDVADAVEALSDLLALPAVPTGDGVPAELDSAVSTLAAALGQAHSGLASALDDAASRLADAEEAWQTFYANVRRDVETQLSEAGFEDADDLLNAQERVATLSRRVRYLPDKEKAREEAETERQKMVKRLWEVRREKSRLIERTVRSLNERVGGRFRIDIAQLADKTLLVDAASAHAGSTQRRTLDRAAEAALNPVNFATAVRDGAAALDRLGLTENGSAVLAAAGATAARDIEVADTPDVCALMMQVEPAGGEWRSVLDVSPGERATATLALALAGGAAPLVIDQPEDDLDNRYIYDEVVRLVTEVCEGRQVIVATHNANIPVLGDAECVLAFQATRDRAEVLACGGLEDPRVAEVARHVLEGGEQAFRERHRRYTRGA